LLDQASRVHPFRLRRIDQRKTKNVFLLASANVKTIPVVRRIQNEATILKNNPITARAEFDNRDAKKTQRQAPRA
jgi:hypothetical protein